MKIQTTAFLLLALAEISQAQLGQTTDWYAYAGDAQRDGWEKGEAKFTSSDVAHFQLLWQRNLAKGGKEVLLPPVILGNLIGYRGFKELAFVAGSHNDLWSMDADLDRMYWTKHFDSRKGAKKTAACPGGLSATPALPAPFVFRMPARSAAQGANPTPPTARRPRSTTARFMTPHPVYLLTSDGMLHQLNQSDGSEMGSPIQFLPPNANAQPMNVAEDVIYTSTSETCAGVPNSVWALDLSGDKPQVNSFELGGVGIAGAGGVILGSEGVVFARTGPGGTADKLANSLLALTPMELKLKQYFVFPESHTTETIATPVAFAYKGKELVAATGGDGSVYLLDAANLGGDDHHQFLSKSPPVGQATGRLSSWEDADGARYVLAAVSGPVNPEFKAPTTNGDVSHGAIAAFKLDDQNGALTLVPEWVSQDMLSPEPPVIAKGVVFTLSDGEFNPKGPVSGTHATLFALDGHSGKQIYSTGDQVKSAGNRKGLSLANGRLYFVTVDNTLNVFGKYLEH